MQVIINEGGEEWKDVPGYPNIQASNMGRIRKTDRLIESNNQFKKDRYTFLIKGHISKGSVNSYGYPTVSIYKNKQARVHRLVAAAWLPNPNNYPQVNHKNGIKTDNSVENLEWCDNSHNQRHKFATGLCPILRGTDKYFSKLNEAAVIDIRNNYNGKEFDLMYFSKKYNVSRTVVSKTKRREMWKHVK